LKETDYDDMTPEEKSSLIGANWTIKDKAAGQG